jgi:hypothetical protein
MTHMTFREPTPTQWLVLAFGLGLGGLWGCDDPEAACSLDGSDWAGEEPECTAEERANDLFLVCTANTMSFRGCEYRRRRTDHVISGTYVDGAEPGSFTFFEPGGEVEGFLQDGGYSLAAPGGPYMRAEADPRLGLD